VLYIVSGGAADIHLSKVCGGSGRQQPICSSLFPDPARPTLSFPDATMSDVIVSAALPGRIALASAEEILDLLDPEQREVAATVRGPVCVLAGAGTGKTRAITARIAYAVRIGMVPPHHALAVTFTTRAAGEMRGRLRTLGVDGVQALTFHAAARRQLAYFWPRVVGGAMPRILESKAPLIAEAVSRCRVSASRLEIRDLAAEIEWAKVTQTVADDYPDASVRAGRQPPYDAPTVANVYRAYDDVKRVRDLVDFEDILLLTVGMLAERADVASEVRSRYRWFVVDEYQDVSPLQQRLLDLWLGDGDDLCVVGDPSQTIYSFTGASPRHLLEFPRRHPDAAVVRLVRDYRSTPQVVGVANTLMSLAPRAPGTPTPVELVAQRPAGPLPSFTEHPDELAEAGGVAARIRDLVEARTPPSEIAVLFRINAQSETYEQALAEAGIPYVLRGAERFFERPEVREAVLLLRGAARSGDPSPDGVGADLRAVLATAGWTSTPPASSGAVRERWEALAALVALGDELAARESGSSLTDVVAEIDARAAVQHAPVVEGVTLASLHAAKGLEWDAVFLVGLTDGMLPISYAVTPEQVEEERRLLYVGMTRAREHLALSWASARTPGGRTGRRPSRFVDEIRPLEESRVPGRAGSRSSRKTVRGTARCRSCSRALSGPVENKLGRCDSCASDVDEGLLVRLKAWRLQRARDASLPAYCIFTDATLLAIAETRPQQVTDLARVPGVGRAKLDKYAAEVLKLCAPE
jgi:DNA helicase II / ATP-dependent DNA helicase PcrA